MGVNYYIRENYCKGCGRYDRRHIGKSSFGWKFLFSTDLGETKKKIMKILNKNKHNIIDEYGNIISLSYLKNLIKKKQTENSHNNDGYHYEDCDGYDFSAHWFC
jgi:hypothetical protein